MRRPDSNFIAALLIETLTHRGFILAVGFGLGVLATVVVLIGC